MIHQLTFIHLTESDERMCTSRSGGGWSSLINYYCTVLYCTLLSMYVASVNEEELDLT